MYYKIFRVPVLSFVFRAAKAIPIAGGKENPKLMVRAFDAVDAALAEGELVCIFPEGGLTLDGEIAPFRAGVEKVLARRPVPVVPLALRGLWRSMWSRRDSRLARAIAAALSCAHRTRGRSAHGWCLQHRTGDGGNGARAARCRGVTAASQGA